MALLKDKKLRFAQAELPALLTPSLGEHPDAPSHTRPWGYPCPTPHQWRGFTGTPSWGAATRLCRPPSSAAPLPDVATIIALACFTLFFLAFLTRLLRLLLLLVLPAHAASKVA